MKLKETLSDYWEIFFSFMNALVVAYDSASRLLQLGWITSEKLSDICTLLFLIFGCVGVWKFTVKARKAEKTAKNAVEKMEVAERQFKDLQIAYANQGKQLEETIFPRTYLHQEFHIKKDSAQNILNYIKGDVSSSPWVVMNGDKISYTINYKESNFFYPDKDNVPLHGVFFSAVKDGEHFSRLFWVSIISSGIGENTLSTVNFETFDKNATEFFNVLRRKLVKHFTIWEPTAGAWR